MLKPILGASLAIVTFVGIACAQAATAADAKVVMYATKTCGYCAKARAYFAEHGTSWEERDIETSAQAAREFKSLGGVGTPLIVIGEEHIAGFQPQRIDAALAKRAVTR